MMIVLFIFTACSVPTVKVATPTESSMQEATMTPVITAIPSSTVTPEPTPEKAKFEFNSKYLPQYGIDFLENMLNDYYKAIDALYNGDTEVYSSNVQTEKEFEKLRRALVVFFIPKNLLYDHMYINGEGPFGFNMNTKKLTIKYALQKEEYLVKVNDFKSIIENIFYNNVTDINNKIETAKELFQYVSKTIEYENDHKLTVYDAFIVHKGYCQTYSKMYQYLLWQVDIEAYLIGSMDHMWNIVNLDGEYYHMDATWDSGNFYYFAMDDRKCFEETEHEEAICIADALLDGKIKIHCTSDKYNNYNFNQN
jgi:hypothetical protein